MRPVYLVSGGVSKFAKARKDATFQVLVQEAFDYALRDLGLEFREGIDLIDGSVASYFSDHFARQLMAGIMIQDFLGLCAKPSHRVEGGGATGGICFQEAWKAVASGYMDICAAYGFETMSRVLTWKGNEFIALASDTNFDFPVGGFYSGYYAMMVTRHMKEFGTTVEQMAGVSVKNHRNAVLNPYAQHAGLVDLGNGEKVEAKNLNVADVRRSAMVAWPLTRLDICTMSDGAAVCLLASEKGLEKLLAKGCKIDSLVRVSGVGRGTDAMRMADRPHLDYDSFMRDCALESEVGIIDAQRYRRLWTKGFRYPGVHSFRAGRQAAKQAYEMAGVRYPVSDLSFIELHDAYTSSEIQTYEDLGLCRYGEGGKFVESGAPFLAQVDYGDIENHFTSLLPRKGILPVNPSGGLIACGHPVGATGLMQAVFALWQLQRNIGRHFGNEILQVPKALRGAIHSHAGTGTYVTVTILEREEK